MADARNAGETERLLRALPLTRRVRAITCAFLVTPENKRMISPRSQAKKAKERTKTNTADVFARMGRGRASFVPTRALAWPRM